MVSGPFSVSYPALESNPGQWNGILGCNPLDHPDPLVPGLEPTTFVPLSRSKRQQQLDRIFVLETQFRFSNQNLG